MQLPPKKHNESTLKDRLTDNAYNKILPGRYLRTDNGDIVEDPAGMFRRVAENIAVAEAAHHDESVHVTPDDVKPDHPRREELIEDIWGEEGKGELTEENASKFAYETVYKKAPDDVQDKMERWADTFEEMMSHLKFMPNSPTLMNAGDELQQLSACFVDSPQDDLRDIHITETEAAEIFQSGGGMGYAFSRLRPYGDNVGSTNGIASGPVTFMRTYDQMCETIAQGGARRGAQMGILNVEHPDIIEFVHAKNKDVSLAMSLGLNDQKDPENTSFKEALEEARELIDEDGKVPEHLRNAVEGHLANFNISVGITDEFMEAVKADKDFTFKNPRTGEPHVVTEHTKEMYERYGLGHYLEVGEEMTLPAQELWDDIIEGAWENGEPGVVYLDRINEEHSFDVEDHPDHEILATNPCVTGDTEVAVADGRGSVPIEELTEEDSPLVYTRDGNSIKVVEADDVWKTEEDADIVEVRTDGRATLRCTEDHEVYVRGKGWIEAGNLNPGDSLDMLYRSPTVGNADYPRVEKTGGDGGLEHRLVGRDINGYGMTVDEYKEKYPEAKISAASNHKVTEIVDVGTADVYDMEVPDTHNFYAATSGNDDYERKEFINIHNCGEQPLEEYEACNLGHINLSTIVDTGVESQDWREYDGSVEEFLDVVIDWSELDRRIEVGTRFLDNVVTMSEFPLEKIEDKVRNQRKIGLGIMGLGQLYVQLGMQYGSDVANTVARELMTYINHESKKVSHKLAMDRGEFDNWDESKYADPTEYPEWFEKHTGLSAEEWDNGFKLRNHNTTTIAPTGTTSMIANTSSGCEPIYNVAFLKNVGQDVQGDEMLVEFDDYFLEMLEANDVDVESVKEEAEQQMMNNNFDGISGLSAVPEDMSELFVTTEDLTAKEHAAVQCELQTGVDSAISKTVNAPNSATQEDTREVFEYIYDHGGKGVTYYRDGTRNKQVLTTRQQNREFADADDEELIAEVEERIEKDEEMAQKLLEVFEDTGTITPDDIVDEIDIGDDERWYENGHYAKKRERPTVLSGNTQRIETGYGKLYVTVNVDEEGRPFELFANMGHSGGFENSFVEALAKTISIALRSGVDPGEIIEELKGNRAPDIAFTDEYGQIRSIPDAIGKALERVYEDGEEEEVTVAELQTPRADGDGCPECGAPLQYSEGCKECSECGWAKC